MTHPQERRLSSIPRASWILALTTIGALIACDRLRQVLIGPRALHKGAVAPYTVRASVDAVYDLRQSYATQSAAARQSYLPIYNRDDDVFFDSREKILSGALAEPQALWRFGARRGSRADGDSRGDAAEPDGSVATDAVDAEVEAADAQRSAVRRRELEALMRACFGILEPYYKAGVIADSEFPSRKAEIRVYSVQHGEAAGRHAVEPVEKFHRFSALQDATEKGARQFFFKTNPGVVAEVIAYIFARLPANVTYARENQQVIDILDVTGVKVVLIRRGEVLIGRGQNIDTQAYDRLRAATAASGNVSPAERTVAHLALLLALLLAYGVCAAEVSPALIISYRAQLMVAGGVVAIAFSGVLGLALSEIHAAALPQALLPLIAAVVFGRVPAIFVGIATAVIVGLVWALDLGGFIVAMVGGVIGAMLARRRQRAGVLAAGVLIGIGQALAQEAARAIDGRPQTYVELLAAAQAFGGGLLSSVLAAVSLPFVQRWLGQSSRGKLKVLADLDHPLLQRLRQQRPEVFVHVVRVADIADRAANAIGADRLLTRCGALFHDIGMLRYRGPAAGTSYAEQARAKIAHVADGLRVAAEHRLPDEVVNMLGEHHGTLELSDLVTQARKDGAAVAMEDFTYPGPRPGSAEAAVLMIADRIEHELGAERVRDAGELVDGVLSYLIAQMQFDRCGLSHDDLQRMRHAIVSFLRSND